jgi:uncharacterized protein YprB with RNaseH-like and TPR domain
MRRRSLEERLKQLPGSGPKKPASKTSSNAPPRRYLKLAEALGGELMSGPAGTFCRVNTLYPFGQPYGVNQLEYTSADSTVAAASFSIKETGHETPLSTLLFFDTETTGLGGTGAVPFLVGFGSLTEDGFEVRQYILPDYTDEAAMLEHTLTEFGADRTAVSYNGVAFDFNLMRDRMIVNRVAREIPCAGHYDLLHSARRLYRRRLADCSLTNVEREIFKFYRTDDIPGHLVPSVYFDWLESEETRQLDQVLEHNRLDILSLYFLLLHIDETFKSEGRNLSHHEDIYSLSRVYGRRKHHGKVTANYRRLEEELAEQPDEESVFFHSLAYKRAGEWEQAATLWRRLADSRSRQGFEASLELAKYHEHRTKDLDAAHRHAKRALKLCPESASQREALRNRLARLQTKLKSAS